MLMLRRLVWSTIIATGIMIPIMLVNFMVYPTAENIPEATRTVAQQLAVQQRNATFFNLTFIDGLLSWGVGFQVSSEFFRANPSAKSIIDLHSRMTGISKEFYKMDSHTTSDANEVEQKDFRESKDDSTPKGETDV